jgi:hypothetical protein
MDLNREHRKNQIEKDEQIQIDFEENNADDLVRGCA